MPKKSGEIKMCKKLQELNGMTADAILLYCGVNSYPVDIKGILKTLRIPFRSYDFSKIEEKNEDLIKRRGKILGAVVVLDNDIEIYYSEGSTENRIRFTLAHELAHCCLQADMFDNKGHVEFRFDSSSPNLAEKAANIFAGQLLIPDRFVEKLHDELIISASDIMAKEFCVSTKVMEARLKYLGMDFYSPQNPDGGSD